MIDDLAEELERRAKGVFRCWICGTDLPSAGRLGGHIKRIHLSKGTNRRRHGDGKGAKATAVARRRPAESASGFASDVMRRLLACDPGSEEERAYLMLVRSMNSNQG